MNKIRKQRKTERAETERKKIEKLKLERDQEELIFDENIKRIKDVIKKSREEEIKGFDLEVMIVQLEESFKRCKETNQKYAPTLEKEEEQEENDKWFEDLVNSYHKMFDGGKKLLNNLVVSKEKTKETSSSMTIKPKAHFDDFEGDIRKYPRFKEQFLLHIKPKYAADEEAFILRSYLGSKIKEEVENLGEDAKAIWDRLDEKYGKVSNLVDAIMSDIKGMKKCENHDPLHTLEFINKIEKAHRDLIYFKKENEITNATIIGAIEAKLPENIEDEWLRLITGDNMDDIERNKFPHLLKLLVGCRQRIEYKCTQLRESSNEQCTETYNVQRDNNSRSEGQRRPWC